MSFIAALDQSGGSTPGALLRYGVEEFTEDNMMDLIHEMRLRIINSPSFTSEYIDTAIIFEDSAKRGIVEVLRKKGIKSYLKIDKGLNDDGTMKPFDIEKAIDTALYYKCSGTKMRSVVNTSNIKEVLEQQFEIAREISQVGITPIVEPEVSIHDPDKSTLEFALCDHLEEYLHSYKSTKVILKLTLPESPNIYDPLLEHSNCLRIVALSGGYSTDEACERLAQNTNMSASFSRGLLEGLSINQTDEEFNEVLKQNIVKINQASYK